MYSLFGNIIENAIEAAGNIDDADKRVISVKIREIAGQISIIEENYTAVMPEFVNGLPRTTKKDTDYHGFGMRSIQLIAKKYGGMLTCSADDGVFRLALLIPLPAAKPEK